MDSPNDVIPIHYEIHLEPDLDRFQFVGKTGVKVRSIKPVREITMNAIELAVWNCRVQKDDDQRDCSFSVNPEKEELTIQLPEEMEGEINLTIEYMGNISQGMTGFYRSRAVINGEEKYIAVTQFEESDARRAFPCFDHPFYKATFDIEMVINSGLQAISNGPVEEETLLEDGRKRVKFQRTPKMSTYLLFFGVGPFEFIEDPGDILVRVATMPGVKEQGEFGLEFGRKSLSFSEDYYGVKYPLPKMDLIAISDFAFGAMENWGAITFRENLLLYDPEKTSKSGEIRICEVIAHEIAHQWFGNLVTPSDWKYLWLNESFATYFGYGIVAHYYPEWELWDQFLQNQTAVALERDSYQNTFPMEIPGGEHVVINTSTAPIIYNKGGSILRQIKGYIGEDNFRKGLRYYLKKYAYDCAASHQLWEALEDVSENPVKDMMKSWVEQPGFPVIELSREGNQLKAVQKRFSYLQNESDQKWLVPLSIRVFYKNRESNTISTLLDGESTFIDIDPDVIAYKANQGQTGFYRARYSDEENLKELLRLAAEKIIPTVDRWGLESDFYAMVKGGMASFADYMAFIKSYSNEEVFLTLTGISGHLFHARLVMGGEWSAKIASFGKSLFEKVLGIIGFDPQPDDPFTISLLRDPLIGFAAHYGSQDVIEFALEKFSSLRKGENVHPDIMKSVMEVGASHGDRQTFEWFKDRLGSSENEHERINMLTAMGCFKDHELFEDIGQYILDHVPARNKFIPIGSMAANPEAVPYMWEWYMKSIEKLEQFHPVHYERVVASIIPFCGIKREQEVKAFFEGYIRKNEKLKDVVELSLERMEINSRMRDSG